MLIFVLGCSGTKNDEQVVLLNVSNEPVTVNVTHLSIEVGVTKIHPEIRDLVSSNADIQKTVEGLDEELKLFDDETIKIGDCESGEEELCFDTLASIKTILSKEYSGSELDQATTSCAYFLINHEIGHKLAMDWNTPLDEEGIDQMMGILIRDPDLLWDYASGASILWMDSLQGDLSQLPYWKKHSFDQQRFGNVMCMVYGSDPSEYAQLAPYL